MDESADRKFVEEYGPLVRKVAARVRAELDLSTELDDLIGYGYRGLLEAKARFDPSRGVQFATFAHYRIRGAILDGVRQMARLPRRVHAQRKAAEAFDREAERVAYERAMQPETRVDLASTIAAIDEILGRTCAAYVIAAVGQSEEDAPRGPDAQVIANEDRARVAAALATLPEREREVIVGFYFQDRTLEELGASMGISRSWASRLHTRALGLLREALEAHYGHDERRK